MNNNFATWFILIAVLILAIVGAVFIAFASKRSPKLKVEKFRARWLAIENSLDKESAPSWQLAILNADKGETMGERMKAAGKVWSNANHIWGAHKIRNHIAHEADVKINYDIARRALAAYKQALKDLGAI